MQGGIARAWQRGFIRPETLQNVSSSQWKTRDEIPRKGHVL